MLTEQQKEFLNDRKHDRAQVKAGYIRHLDKSVQKQYESLYREIINSSFILDYYCSSCVFSMVKEIYSKVEQLERQETEASQITQESDNGEAETKRGRKKKSEDKTGK